MNNTQNDIVEIRGTRGMGSDSTDVFLILPKAKNKLEEMIRFEKFCHDRVGKYYNYDIFYTWVGEDSYYSELKYGNITLDDIVPYRIINTDILFNITLEKYFNELFCGHDMYHELGDSKKVETDWLTYFDPPLISNGKYKCNEIDICAKCNYKLCKYCSSGKYCFNHDRTILKCE